jgi:DNA-directed RNA polymerase subunit beta
MPYLQDGTRLEMLLNPLGIPSRMNVGQVFECLISLAGKNLKENYKIFPFEESQNKISSKNIIYKKLYEARIKTKKEWLFDFNYPGKMKIFDGKRGKPYKQHITIGYAYILKLMHVVKDKLTSRSIGPYSLITKQPLKGKAKNGGQRFGEMEIWAIEGFGCAYLLQEVLTIKSDDLNNKYKMLNAIIEGNCVPSPKTPESLKVFIIELNSLCLNIKIYNKNIKTTFF